MQTDILKRIETGMSSLIGFSADADRMKEPYFVMIKHPDGHVELEHSGPIGIPHCTGRALDALFLGESVTGKKIPVEIEESLTFYHFASYANADGLNSYNDYKNEGNRFIEMHNIREGLLGLVALLKFRKDSRVVPIAERMLCTISKLATEEGELSVEMAKEIGIQDRLQGLQGPCPMTSGRFIRALVRYYKETQSEAALDMATRFVNYILKIAFTKEGWLTEKAGDHGHSITATVEAILEYAILKKDQTMIDLCRKIYDNGLSSFRSDTGWCSELVSGNSGRGEMNNTGDLIQIALLLGKCGYTRYFEDAERFMRSHMLPAQLMDASTLPENADGTGDCLREIRNRATGSFGFPLVNDRFLPGERIDIATMDITAGAVQALCEFYNAIVDVKGNAISINLLFDIITPHVIVKSDLPGLGNVQINVLSRGMLRVRAPYWKDYSGITALIDGVQVENLEISEGYLIFHDIRVNSLVTICFGVPEKVTKEALLEKEYTLKWMGSQVVAIEPEGLEQPLFGTMNEVKSRRKQNETSK